MLEAREAQLKESFGRCVRQYYRLCATQRVVGSGARAPQLLPDPVRLDALRERLGAVSARLRGQDASGSTDEIGHDLERLAGELEAYGDEIRTALPRLDLALLRGCLPGLRDTARKDVASFLDLCVGRPRQIPSLIELIEYVVTVLATEDEAGQRRVVCDPTTLTSRIAKITQSRAGETSHDLQAVVSEAVADLGSPDRVRGVIERMRAHKSRLNERFFVPGVMRAVVEFNVAVGNRLEELSSAQRILDESEAERTFDLEEDASKGKQASAPTPQAEELTAVVQALRDRLRRAGLTAGPAGSIASVVGTSDFTAFERRMLSTDAADPIANATRSVIVLGLIVRHHEAVRRHLEELGVDWDRLATEWAPQAREALRAHISAEVSAGRYAESRTLALVLTRYLPSASFSREEPSAERLPEARAAGIRGTGVRRSGRSRKPEAATTRFPREWRSPRVAALAVLVVVLGGLVVNRVAPRGADVTALTPAELAGISPYLVSGVRNASGDSLIGTLDGDWIALGPRERPLHAGHIERALRAMNVKNAMLFDEKRRLQMHYGGGRIAHLRRSR